MAKDTAPEAAKPLMARMKSTQSEMDELFEQLEGEREKLRAIDREGQRFAGPQGQKTDRYAQQQQSVQQVSDRIAKLSREHNELAKAHALISGGTNYQVDFGGEE